MSRAPARAIADRQSCRRAKVPAQVLRQRVRVSVGVAFAAAMKPGLGRRADLGLKGKVALVAASSKGLGKASALALAREGARVTIFARTEADLAAAAGQLRD